METEKLSLYNARQKALALSWQYQDDPWCVVDKRGKQAKTLPLSMVEEYTENGWGLVTAFLWGRELSENELAKRRAK